MPDGSLIIVTKIDATGIASEIVQAEKDAVGKGKALGEAVGKAVSTATKNNVKLDNLIGTESLLNGLNAIGAAAKTAAVALGTTLVGAVGGAVKVGSDFYAAMSRVEAITGGTAEEMSYLSEKAREMGRTTVFSATECADAFKYMAVAGAGPEKMLESLNGIVNLAAGSGLELSRTAEIVADSLEAFGVAASDTDHFANVLAATTNVANVEIGQLGETLKYIAPVASALGFNIEDTSVALALMANQGIKAGQAGTTLRAGLTSMVNPSTKAKEALEKYGIELSNADGTMKSLAEIMEELRLKLGGLNQAEQAQAAATIFGTEAMSGFLAIINSTDEQLSDAVSAIEGADAAFNGLGAAAGMAKTATDNLQGDLGRLTGALEGIGIQIYDQLDEPMRAAVQSITDGMSTVSTALEKPEVQAAIQTIGDAIAGLIETIVGFVSEHLEGFLTTVARLIENFDKFGPVLAGVVTAFTLFKGALQVKAMIDAGQNIGLLGTVMGVLTGQITLATAAQALLNTVMMAAPYAIAAVVIGGLIAGVIALATHQNKLSDETQALVDRTRELAEAGRESARVFREQMDAIQEAKDAMAEESASVTDLLKQWAALNNISDKTEATMAAQASVMGELAELVPSLAGAYDKHTGALRITEQELAALIALEQERKVEELAKQELAAAAAMVESAQARKEQAEQAARDILVRKTALEELVTAYETTGVSASKFAELGVNGAAAAKKEIEELEAQLSKTGDAYTEHQSAVAGLAEATEVYEEASGVLSTSLQKQANAEKLLSEKQNERAQRIQDINDRTKEVVDATDAATEKVAAFQEEINKEAQAFENAQDAIDRQTDVLTILADRYEELSGKASLTREEQEELAGVTSMLASKIPAVADAIAETGSAAGISADEMRKYVSAQAAMDTGTEAQERLADVLLSVAKNSDELATARESLAAATAEQAAMEAQLLETDWTGRMEEQNALLKAQEELNNSTDELAKGVATLEANEADLQVQQQALGATILESQEAVNQAYSEGILVGDAYIERKKQLVELEKQLEKERADAAAEIGKSIQSAQDALIADMEKSYERYLSIATNGLSKLNTEGGISLREFQANLVANQKALAAWSENMKILEAAGASGAALSYLRELGPEQSRIIQELVDDLNKTGGEGLKEFEKTMAEGAEAAMDATTQQFEAGSTEAKAAAKAIVDEMVLGIKDNEELANALAELVRETSENALADEAMAAGLKDVGEKLPGIIAEGMTEKTDISDTLKTALSTAAADVATEIETLDFAANVGQPIVTDSAAGITDNAEETIQAAAKEAIANTSTDMGTQVTTEDFAQHGKQAIEDTAAGIATTTPDLTSAVKDSVSQAASTANMAVSMANFQGIGRNIPDGMANGVRSGTGVLVSAVQYMVSQALSAARAALDSHSPSRKFEDIGDDSVDGYLLPFENEAKRGVRTVADFMTSMAAGAAQRNMEIAGASGAVNTSSVVHEGDTILQLDNLTLEVAQLNDDQDIRELARRITAEIGGQFRAQRRLKGAFA